LLGAVFLFGLCGAASSLFFYGGESWHNYLVPIPFGIACALLFLRSTWVIFVVPLYIVVWLVALNVAKRMDMSVSSHSIYVPMCIAGLIGGFGVCLASGIVRRCLLSLRHLLGASVIGCVLALPFGLDLTDWHAQMLQPWLQFAIWQSGVGTYLYASCKGLGRKSDSWATNSDHR